MKHFLKPLFVIAICAIPILAMAQPESCKVKATGSKANIKDFAQAYCSQCEQGSFESQALDAFNKGNSDDCVVDTKNGFVKYSAEQEDDAIETIEMCFWNTTNKNEKLVAVNRLSENGGVGESFLYFYRYNVKNKEMKLIDLPFDREPQPVDMLNKKVSKKVKKLVKTAQNEDANKYMPFYQLPRAGKDITFRMSDPTAVPKTMQRTGTMKWNGASFNIK